VFAGIAAGFAVGLSRALSGRAVAVGLGAITLLYFAIADFLYAGRLAAYVAILEMPEEPSLQMSLNVPPGGAVDRSELILSDMPMLS
jgi:hypothetical protein